MCGFSGFFGLANAKEFSNIEDLLIDSCFKIKTRGPDAHERVVRPDLGIAFGHNRLKIKDLSDQANQPFWSEDGNYCLLFNGQIYNFEQIKLALLEKGFSFKTDCDTEVFLSAYQAFGEKAFDEFQGMFAAAIYSKVENSVVLIRDRFGVKPLYFTIIEESLFFSSQLNSLQTLVNKKSALSLFSVYHYLQLMAVPAPFTILENYFKLPAGFLIKFSPGKPLVIKKWYDIIDASRPQFSKHPKENLERFDFLLNNSVSQRVSDSQARTTMFLSGGVDSAAIAKIASLDKKIDEAFHINFVGSRHTDELTQVGEIAKQCNIRLNIIEADKSSFQVARNDFLEQLDDAVADPVCIPFFLLSKAARSSDFKIALTGEGADEALWGYPFYFKHLTLDYWLKKVVFLIPDFIAKKACSPYQYFSISRLKANKSSFLSGAIMFFEQELTELKKLILLQGITAQKEVLLKFFNKENIDLFDSSTWIAQSAENLAPDKKIFYRELSHRLPELLLARCDKVGMMHSVETRVPFLDHNLVEFLFDLPLTQKTKPTRPKMLLKKLTDKYFPKNCFNKKIGFSAPLLTQDLVVMPKLLTGLLPLENLSLLQKWGLQVLAVLEQEYT